ncbi:hypothetical protein DFH07DRAFT_220338 [Mycena maculata]|uniref:Uncharacterized protein n=1 Tax=Mycena maculata TaxID=230809 RepID=A0AAD7HWD2_9AGAR|nr:hypothetical protein DFH07DRAFT_220338 [Mycena maculata]
MSDFSHLSTLNLGATLDLVLALGARARRTDMGVEGHRRTCVTLRSCSGTTIGVRSRHSPTPAYRPHRKLRSQPPRAPQVFPHLHPFLCRSLAASSAAHGQVVPIPASFRRSNSNSSGVGVQRVPKQRGGVVPAARARDDECQYQSGCGYERERGWRKQLRTQLHQLEPRELRAPPPPASQSQAQAQLTSYILGPSPASNYASSTSSTSYPSTSSTLSPTRRQA